MSLILIAYCMLLAECKYLRAMDFEDPILLGWSISPARQGNMKVLLSFALQFCYENVFVLDTLLLYAPG